MNGAESTRDSNIRNEIMSQVLRIVEEQFEVPADDPIHVPAVVIVSALFAGPDVDAITRLTGCSRESVEAIASRMQASKICAPTRLITTGSAVIHS